MRTVTHLSIAAILAVSCGAAGAADDAALKHARELARQAIVFDGHNDLPWAIRNYGPAPMNVDAYDLRVKAPGAGQTDIPRLRAGGVGAQFWSVYTPGEAAGGYAHTQLEQIDIARRLIERYPEAFQLALTADDVRKARASGHIASLLGIEGGHAIENSLALLRTYYDLGVRYMTLTHNTHTEWADSAAQQPPAHGGLTPFGEQVVREMNRLGMLVDLSHVSPETMDDALRVTQAPVIFSHSSARALCDVPRNVPDDILRRMKNNGGVVMVTFVQDFIDPAVAKVTQPATEELNRRMKELNDPSQREAVEKEIFGRLELPVSPIGLVADHIEHVRDVAGIDHVGLGGDFDGNEEWPEGLTDVSTYPNLLAELIRRGWSDAHLRKLAGENVLRALKRAEVVAAKLGSAPAG
jgi:membrane dipeptidase